MAGAAEHNDDIEQKMAELEGDLAKMKKLAGVLKMKFTNREGDAARLLSRLSRNLEDGDLASRAAQEMARLRTLRDDVMMAYEIIALHDMMPEALFTSDYEPKMLEMRNKLEALESKITQCAAEARENRRQRVAAIAVGEVVTASGLQVHLNCLPLAFWKPEIFRLVTGGVSQPRPDNPSKQSWPCNVVNIGQGICSVQYQ